MRTYHDLTIKENFILSLKLISKPSEEHRCPEMDSEKRIFAQTVYRFVYGISFDTHALITHLERFVM